MNKKQEQKLLTKSLSGNRNKQYNIFCSLAPQSSHVGHLGLSARKLKFNRTTCNAYPYSIQQFQTRLSPELFNVLNPILVSGTKGQLYNLVSHDTDETAAIIIDVLALSHLEIVDLGLHGNEPVSLEICCRRWDDTQKTNNILLANRKLSIPVADQLRYSEIPIPEYSLQHAENLYDVIQLQAMYQSDQTALQRKWRKKHKCDGQTLLSRVRDGQINPEGMHPQLPSILNKLAPETFLSVGKTPNAKGEMHIRHERNITFNGAFHGSKYVEDSIYTGTRTFNITVKRLIKKGMPREVAEKEALKAWIKSSDTERAKTEKLLKEAKQAEARLLKEAKQAEGKLLKEAKQAEARLLKQSKVAEGQLATEGQANLVTEVQAEAISVQEGSKRVMYRGGSSSGGMSQVKSIGTSEEGSSRAGLKRASGSSVSSQVLNDPKKRKGFKTSSEPSQAQISGSPLKTITLPASNLPLSSLSVSMFQRKQSNEQREVCYKLAPPTQLYGESLHKGNTQSISIWGPGAVILLAGLGYGLKLLNGDGAIQKARHNPTNVGSIRDDVGGSNYSKNKPLPTPEG